MRLPPQYDLDPEELAVIFVEALTATLTAGIALLIFFYLFGA